MSELKWNWAYYPYLDPPEKQKESALKAGYIKVVNKDEADKVLAEKDAEIAELKEQVHDYAQGLYVLQARAEKEARHQKYKRCLAMAEMCKARYDEEDARINGRGASWDCARFVRTASKGRKGSPTPKVQAELDADICELIFSKVKELKKEGK